MQILLNTILLEPNRWTTDKIPHKPLENLLTKVKKFGFDKLEIWQYHISQHSEKEIRRLIDIMKALNMTCPVLGAYPALHLFGKNTEESRKFTHLIQIAVKLNVKIFKVFAGNIASKKMNPKQKKKALQSLHTLALQLDAHGISLAIETHANTLCDTPNSTIKTLQSLSVSKNVGCCFQPYMDNNTQKAIEFFEEILPWITHVHLQNRKTKKLKCCLLSEGDWIDYNILIPHLLKSKYNGDLSIEFTADMATPDDPDKPIESILKNAALDRHFVLSNWFKQESNCCIKCT